MPSVRVQSSGAVVTLTFDEGATIDDLRARIAAELHVPASRRGSRPSTSASSFSYPSTPALSEADSEISDVFRRLETLELQLREEREKRKETEREISRMLEAKASPPAKKKG